VARNALEIAEQKGHFAIFALVDALTRRRRALWDVRIACQRPDESAEAGAA